MANPQGIRVWVKSKPNHELDIKNRKEKVDSDAEPILITWSLHDPKDLGVKFNAVGFFEWLPPKPPAGIFSEPFLSPDRKRIFMDDVYPVQNGTPVEWKYKLHATGDDGTPYETKEGDDSGDGNGVASSGKRATTSALGVSGGGNESARPVSNPAIINR